jgi:hypothetical protein
MNTNLLIRDWACELVLLIEESKAEAAPGDAFAEGRRFGMAEALSLLQQEAQSFGIDQAALGLPAEDAMTLA